MLSLFTDGTLVFAENLKDDTKKLLEIISDYSKVVGDQVNI